MTNHLYTGNSISVNKIAIVGKNSSNYSLSGEIKIGLGNRLLGPFASWDKDDIIEAWNSSSDLMISEITAIEEPNNTYLTDAIRFTHSKSGEDFEVKVLVDDVEVLVANEIQTLSFPIASTGGTYTLTFNGQTTGNIAYNANAATIQTALEALSNVGTGDIIVAAVGSTFTMNFGSGAYAGLNVPLITGTPTNLTGGTASITVTTNSTGSAAANAVQTIDITNSATGGTFGLRIQRSNGVGGVFAVGNLAYNISAADLQTAINTVMGASSVSCSGGALPNTAIAITFSGNGFNNTAMSEIVAWSALTGSFNGAITKTTVLSELTPTDKTNTWELTIIPGEGTPGVKVNDTSESTIILLNIETSTGEVGIGADEAAVPGVANNRIRVRFPNLTAERLEMIINEYFGEEVVRVTKIIHSLEHAEIDLETYGAADSVLKGWYYRDVYRLVFINNYADPDTIVDINVVLPEVTDGAGTHVINPSNFMELNLSSLGSSFDDLTDESMLIAYLFYYADVKSQDLHEFSITETNEDVETNLIYDFKLNTQYLVDKTLAINLGRIGIAQIVADAKMTFKWCRYTISNQEAATHTKAFTTLCQTPLLSIFSSPEEVRYALERMIVKTSDSTPVWFGVGNVSVTGSLRNSWLNVDHSDYSSLSVELLGVLENMDLDNYNYELICELVTDYTWAGNQDFKLPQLYSCVHQKPIMPLQNKRVKFSIQGSPPDLRLLNASGTSVEFTLSSTLSSVETSINSSFGVMPENSALSYIDSTYAYIPVISSHWIPDHFRKAVRFHGTTFSLDPFEIEYTGMGYQYTNDLDLSLQAKINTYSSIGSVVNTTTGKAATAEVQVLTPTVAPTRGTFTLTVMAATTSALAYNASASTIQTALEGLGSVGSGNVTCTGGPINSAAVTCTFATSLGDVSTIVVTPTLHNGTVSIARTQYGGRDGALGVYELVKGGPAYFNISENWNSGSLPSTDDTVTIDTGISPIKFGINLVDTFIVIGTDGRCMLSSRRYKFVEGQKVTISTSNTLPTGLSAQDYYIRNHDKYGTFYLSATSNGSLIALSDKGAGTHSIFIESLTLIQYSRYEGKQIGLPRLRNNGLLEYLPTYLKAGFTSIELGVDSGTGLSIGKFDTYIKACDVTVHLSNSGSDGIPAILLLFDNSSSTLVVEEADVGIAIYSDETSTLDSIDQSTEGGSLLISNTTVNETLDSPTNVTIRRSTIGNTLNIGN